MANKLFNKLSKEKLSPKKAKEEFVKQGLHGDGKSSDKVAGDKRSKASKLYQMG
jgi:hypothetical protein